MTMRDDELALSPAATFRQRIAALALDDPNYAVQFVDALLAAGLAVGASDLHLQPTPAGLEVGWRVDGVLHPLAVASPRVAANIVARLKVLAELLTYRNDVPQEGRIRGGEPAVERRVSTFPTLYGEKAVVRLFATQGRYEQLADLGLPADILHRVEALLTETAGALLITGPAGSGKTTTAYACLRAVVAASGGGRAIVSLEDPIEVAVPGVAQSQVHAAAGFDLAAGLRFVLRQDPEVILVGEMRDRPTAETAFQAALTGHLVLTTFHAGSAAAAVNRLLDMGLEPYVLRSGVLAIVNQRLVRRLCDCAQDDADPDARLGLPVARHRRAVGCDACGGTGYRGRAVVAEMLVPGGGELGRAILARDDAARLEQLAAAAGTVTRWRRACELVEAGTTTPAEVRRVLGWSGPGGAWCPRS